MRLIDFIGVEGLEIKEIETQKDHKKKLQATSEIIITPDIFKFEKKRPGDDSLYYFDCAMVVFSESGIAKDADKKNIDPKSGIFNDSILFMANFQKCIFRDVDFSGIDEKVFGTIQFKDCKFEGSCKLPKGYIHDVTAINVQSGEKVKRGIDISLERLSNKGGNIAR
jgi:hypothetical protein